LTGQAKLLGRRRGQFKATGTHVHIHQISRQFDLTAVSKSRQCCEF